MNQLASKYNGDSFKKKMEQFLHNIPNCSYIFEVTKMCGFSEFFTIYKDNTLADLHTNLSLQLKSDCIKRLYMIHYKTLERINVPVDKNTTVRDFIVNSNCFNLVYDLHTPAVYKIYLEYGTVNNEDNAEFDEFNEFC